MLTQKIELDKTLMYNRHTAHSLKRVRPLAPKEREKLLATLKDCQDARLVLSDCGFFTEFTEEPVYRKVRSCIDRAEKSIGSEKLLQYFCAQVNLQTTNGSFKILMRAKTLALTAIPERSRIPSDLLRLYFQMEEKNFTGEKARAICKYIEDKEEKAKNKAANNNGKSKKGKGKKEKFPYRRKAKAPVPSTDTIGTFE